MNDADILELVVDGKLDSSEVESFKDLNDDLQQMVADGELTLEEAQGLG